MEVVIVEDLLSAKRLADAGFYSIPLLGTYLSTKQFLILKGMDISKIYLWLDDDAHVKALELVKRLQLIAPVRFIRSRYEPKQLNRNTIRQLIRNEK